MDRSVFTLFETPIGRCALVWRGSFVVGAALPEGSDAETRQRLVRRFPDASEGDPPAWVRAAIEAVRELLSGAPADLSFIDVDLSGTPGFERQVYAAARAIPPGAVQTYGELAQAIGTPGAAQAVGRALARNPVPIIIPCHRILASAGGSGGFSAPGGVSTKLKMLEIEGARRSAEPELFENLPWAAKPAG
ncbi:methylated-DNA--[protein]-cysteine S-methyltransferase [Allosphingosinicella sp.]|uniref:methylated-DNA--[protein]-cysteine S-methyltransferase n=1 Tax=Allosphingosinicella sp. TaxID=2823234 RepID=UPI002FC19446